MYAKQVVSWARKRGGTGPWKRWDTITAKITVRVHRKMRTAKYSTPPIPLFLSLFLYLCLDARRIPRRWISSRRHEIWPSIPRHPAASDTILTARCDALGSHTGNWVGLNRSRGHFDVYRNEGPSRDAACCLRFFLANLFNYNWIKYTVSTRFEEQNGP